MPPSHLAVSSTLLILATEAAPQPRALGAGAAICLWAVFNVLIALLPLAISPLLASAYGAEVRYDWKLLRDGELFFFSSALSAAAMGKMVELDVRGEAVIDVFAFLALCVILLVSAICFGAAVMSKLRREREPAAPAETSPGSGGGDRFAKLSLWIAVSAIVVGFIAFYRGGFR